MPHVLELSFGVDRNVWAMVDILYQDEKERQVLKLKPWLGPLTAGIFPLQKDEKITKAAEEIRASLSRRFKVFFDEGGSIGRRYARMDEVGTPFCITVDFSTVDPASKDFGTVTVRERDTKGSGKGKNHRTRPTFWQTKRLIYLSFTSVLKVFGWRTTGLLTATRWR